MIIDIFLSHKHEAAVFDLSQGGVWQAQKEFVLFASGLMQGNERSGAARCARETEGEGSGYRSLHKKKSRGNIPRLLADLGAV